jgi:hypothetical protein
MNNRPVVTLDVARAVLWHFGDRNLGQEPGHFVARLLVLASAADEENLAKLRVGWPEHVYAWEQVARKAWGLDWLRGIVKDYLDGRELALDFFVGAER